MKIYYATTNQGKISSLKREVVPIGVVIEQANVAIEEPRSSDVEEISLHKISQAYRLIGNRPVVALDSGFYIHSLNGFPAAFVNFTLGTIGVDGILHLVRGKDRSCEFRECLSYMDDKLEEPMTFVVHIKGIIIDEPRGQMQPHHWSKLCLVFVPEGYTKTLAEMSPEEFSEWRQKGKGRISSEHQFAKWLEINRL